jgi:hypothetical protein
MAALAASICHICEANATSRCSACKEVFYCSVEHQRADWKSHKSDCERRRAARARVTLEKEKAQQNLPVEPGFCGIHGKTDTSQYIHALNVRFFKTFNIPLSLSLSLVHLLPPLLVTTKNKNNCLKFPRY